LPRPSADSSKRSRTAVDAVILWSRGARKTQRHLLVPDASAILRRKRHSGSRARVFELVHLATTKDGALIEPVVVATSARAALRTEERGTNALSAASLPSLRRGARSRCRRHSARASAVLVSSSAVSDDRGNSSMRGEGSPARKGVACVCWRLNR